MEHSNSTAKTDKTDRAAGAALPRAIAAAAAQVDSVLETVLPRPHGPQGRVQEAMRYATFAGGKRLQALSGAPRRPAVRGG